MFGKSITAALLGTSLLATAAFAQTATTDRTHPAPAATSSSSESHAQGQWRASKLVGLNVYNEANESLGDINDLLTDAQGKVTQVVLGVGGFLGVGERYVAVPFEKVKWINQPVSTGGTAMNSRPVGPATTPSTGTTPSTTTGSATTATTSSATTSNANRWYPDHAVYNATKDELKSLPEFKYNQ